MLLYTVPDDADNVPAVYPLAALTLAVHVVPYLTVNDWLELVDVLVTVDVPG